MVAYTLAMLIALLATRDSFPARPDSGSLPPSRFVPAYLAIAFGFGRSRCCSSRSTWWSS